MTWNYILFYKLKKKNKLIKKLHPKRTFIIKVMLTDTLRVKVNKMKYLILFFFFFYKIEFLL